MKNSLDTIDNTDTALAYREEIRDIEAHPVRNEGVKLLKSSPSLSYKDDARQNNYHYLLNPSGSDFSSLPVVDINKLVKRWTDITFAFLVILGALPLFILVPFLIWVFDGKPIFFTSYRFIRKNKGVKTYKFRSMVRDAESGRYQLTKKYMREGYLDIPLKAEVYTPIGRFLERTQLVEIPQLLNVLFGQMSFVGNRPLPRKNIEFLKQKVGWQERFYSPAGLTGIAQVVGKFNLSPDERLNLERMYSSVYQSGNILVCDIHIIIRTFILLVFGKALPIDKARRLLVKCGSQLQK